MDEALAAGKSGAPHGTVITAAFQTAGRGRLPGRRWQGCAGENVMCTVLLRYGGFSRIPACLTLRAGAAVHAALSDFPAAADGAFEIKWPNDLMLNGKKTAGILAESDGTTARIGIGVNVLQRNFDALSGATSLALETPSPLPPPHPLKTLEKILFSLHAELETRGETDWNARLNRHLFMKNKPVSFFEISKERGNGIQGILRAVAADGALALTDGGGRELLFYAGELGWEPARPGGVA
jgi:BirA family biotin operon repressor/biotin-[acetyl-CoA-carboxylase] ligase